MRSLLLPLRGLNLYFVGDDPRAKIMFEHVLHIGLLCKSRDHWHHGHRYISTFGCRTLHRFRGLHRRLHRRHRVRPSRIIRIKHPLGVHLAVTFITEAPTMSEYEERASIAVLRVRLGILVSFGIVEEHAPLERRARVIDLLELNVYPRDVL